LRDFTFFEQSRVNRDFCPSWIVRQAEKIGNNVHLSASSLQLINQRIGKEVSHAIAWQPD